MNIFCSWTIDNYLALITIILMAIGGFFALIQWNSAKKLRRAEFIDKIISVIRFDKDISKTMYTIDYDQSWYTQDFHNGNSGLEYQIDRLLSYTDFICYLYSTKNIHNSEFEILKYEINRICISPSVQAYLWNLYHFSKRMKSGCSFMHLIDYGIKNKLIKNEFKENNNNLYRKYLNF